ncbi:MAG: hypothetical protein H7A46_26090 [Verrucomicrobiales bacterium]|nr:hypothetical protein [Verrucomicrobiales bacterium]
MKVRLKKTHLVNGREFPSGTVLQFKDATAEGLIASKVAEPFDPPKEPAKPVNPKK